MSAIDRPLTQKARCLVMKLHQLLRNNPDFARLWGAQVVSLLGDWFNTIALSVLVASYSGGSGVAVSLFLMARFLPPMLFGPFAGILVDRFNRKWVLVYCNLLRTVVVLGYLLADSPDRLWLIYLLTIAQFTLSALFEPGQAAILPRLVPGGDLVLANTLTSITWSTMLAIGAIIGGIVAGLFGIVVALILDAMTFFVAAALIATIQTDAAPDSSDDAPQAKGSGGFLEGVRFLRNNPAAASTLMVKGGYSLGNPDTLTTIFATQLFVIGSGGQVSLGLLYSAFGVGALIGPLLTNRLHDGSVRQMRYWIAVAFIGATIGWALMGWAGSLMIVALALFIRALGSSISWTYSTIIIQRSVPDRLLGRVFAIDLSFFHLSTVVSILIHGMLIDALNSPVVAAGLTNSFAPWLSTSLLGPSSTMTAANLSLIAVLTGVASLVPLLAWGGFQLHLYRRTPHQAHATAD